MQPPGDLEQLMDRYSYSVVVGFHVRNETPYTLTDPVMRVKEGVIETPLDNIPPNSSAMFVVRKTAGVPFGSQGTTSWKISPRNEDPRRVVVMWSVPFNHVFFSNYLALGISDPVRDAPDFEWFETMYGSVTGKQEADSHRNGIYFCRKKRYQDAEEIELGRDGIRVVGNMEASMKARVTLTIREEAPAPVGQRNGRQQAQ